MTNRISILLFCCIVLFSSCSKENEEEKLTGSWDMVFLLASEQENRTVWTFAEDHTLTVTDYTPDSTYVYSSTYVVNKDFPSTFYIDISGLDIGYDLSGRYQIIKLNKNFLIIQRIQMSSGSKPGAYLWREFVKLNQ